jgi:hypothetical protein
LYGRYIIGRESPYTANEKPESLERDCCAAADTPDIANAASDAIKPSQSVLLAGMMNSHVLIDARFAAF